MSFSRQQTILSTLELDGGLTGMAYHAGNSGWPGPGTQRRWNPAPQTECRDRSRAAPLSRVGSYKQGAAIPGEGRDAGGGPGRQRSEPVRAWSRRVARSSSLASFSSSRVAVMWSRDHCPTPCSLERAAGAQGGSGHSDRVLRDTYGSLAWSINVCQFEKACPADLMKHREIGTL